MNAPSVSTRAITQPGHRAGMTPASATALVATLGIATACWVLTIPRMSGMNMGVATQLGSFPFFLSIWIPMMAAMMLPGTAPAAFRLAQSGLRALQVPRFVGAYLVVWTLFGVVMYALYWPHGAVAAGAVTIAAGVYELTPTKRRYRERCRSMGPSGTGLALCCVGSSIGLMVMMVALGAMSLAFMVITGLIVFAQKLLPPRAAADVPVALAIIALGVVILLAPSAIPGVVPAMHHIPAMGHMAP